VPRPNARSAEFAFNGSAAGLPSLVNQPTVREAWNTIVHSFRELAAPLATRLGDGGVLVTYEIDGRAISPMGGEPAMSTTRRLLQTASAASSSGKSAETFRAQRCAALKIHVIRP
jgi:hypothetical protein